MSVAGCPRDEVVALAARYAESLAWLYEDSGDSVAARRWTTRALRWALQSDDGLLTAWVAYRQSQQLTDSRQSAMALQQVRLARRNEDVLATPMRAALRVQEACGLAMEGDEGQALRLLDEAHGWAANDTHGEARAGNGSFCTASYIEVQRARCLAVSGRDQAAIHAYEQALPGMAPVYRRDRAAALAGLAASFAACEMPDQAAASARVALAVARGAGSNRTVEQVAAVGRRLSGMRRITEVAELLDDLAEGEDRRGDHG
jgi:tetratricopeptide (TPR) repeat protein